MATHLDLEEQEQIDQLKEFWNRYGNLIVWILILVLAAYGGWQGWQYWQRKQAAEAGVLFEELDRAAQGGDLERVTRLFADIRDRYGRTTYAEQAALVAAQLQHGKGKADSAQETLKWTADHASQEEYRAIARLRLAGLLLDQKRHDEALKLLADMPAAFQALAADRRGDVLQAQGKKAEAVKAYQEAWQKMGEKVDYRRIVQTKLEALGVAVDTPAAPAASAGVAS